MNNYSIEDIEKKHMHVLRENMMENGTRMFKFMDTKTKGPMYNEAYIVLYNNESWDCMLTKDQLKKWLSSTPSISKYNFQQLPFIDVFVPIFKVEVTECYTIEEDDE